MWLKGLTRLWRKISDVTFFWTKTGESSNRKMNIWDFQIWPKLLICWIWTTMVNCPVPKSAHSWEPSKSSRTEPSWTSFSTRSTVTTERSQNPSFWSTWSKRRNRLKQIKLFVVGLLPSTKLLSTNWPNNSKPTTPTKTASSTCKNWVKSLAKQPALPIRR